MKAKAILCVLASIAAFLVEGVTSSLAFGIVAGYTLGDLIDFIISIFKK